MTININQIIVKSRQRVKVDYVFIAAMFVLSSIFGILSSQNVSADDLTTYSPNESALNHILIYSNHGTVKKVTLGVYYNATQKGNVSINILGGSGSDCRVDNKVSNGKLATVSWDGVEKASWRRNQDFLCDNRPRNQGNNGTLQDGHMNQRSFDVSTASGKLVAGTNLKRSVISVDLTSEATSYSPSERGKDDSDDTKFTFKVMSSSGTKIGNIDTSISNASPNNSVLAREGQSGYKDLEYGFGFPCNVTNASRQTLTVYDADNGTGNQPNSLYYYIDAFVNGAWKRVNVTRVNSLDKISNNSVIPRSAGDDNVVSSVTFQMEPAVKYRLVVRNLWADKHNYIYVGMPGDSIFGDSSIQCGSANLNPTDTVTVQGVNTYTNDNKNILAYPGRKITFNHPVNNSGGSSITSNTSFIQQGDVNPSVQWSSSPSAKKVTYVSGNNDIAGGQRQLTDEDVGKVFCEKITVNPGSYAGAAKSSPGICVRVIPPPGIPTVHVTGYDTRTRSKIITRTQTNKLSGDTSNNEYGSWGEYGSFSVGKNSGFATASTLNKGAGASNERDKLTFANTTNSCSSSEIGCYQDSIEYPSSTVAELSSHCGSNSDNYTINDAMSITTTKYICAKNTVYINKDITGSGGNTSNISGLPQLVIIAKDIVIAKDVTNVDAWLIAKPDSDTSGGRISTCSNVGGTNFPSFSQITRVSGLSGGLDKNTCGQNLTVNGPVIANSIYLYRTKPVDKNDSFAERFNMRADAFLWAYNGGSDGSSAPVAQTTSIQELPPRF